MKYISFSLWGSNDAYLDGIISNGRTVQAVYPDWTPICYYDDSVPRSAISCLASDGWMLQRMPRSKGSSGAFWRFDAAFRPEATFVIFRDADSLIGSREKAAVDEWLTKDTDFHIMRDHPGHTFPIMAGMWGCKAAALRPLRARMNRWNQRTSYADDQRMLEYLVYPNALSSAVIHSNFAIFAGEQVRPLPLPRVNGEFVGMSRSRADRPAYGLAIADNGPFLLPSPARLKRRSALLLRSYLRPFWK